MICDEQSGQQFYRKTEIEMSTEMKSKIDADPTLAAHIADCLEAVGAERNAEFLKRNDKKPISIEEMMNDSDSEDEDNEEPKDRWNSPNPGREATCVNLIKAIAENCISSSANTGTMELTYKGIAVLGVNDETGEFDYQLLRKFGWAFTSWLVLNEHKLDGKGGNWSSGCFGSFWADIALTIPNLKGIYYGCRVAFNPTPKADKEAFFIININEKLESLNPFKIMKYRSSTACFPEYGPQVNWGLKMCDLCAVNDKKRKAKNAVIEAERQRVKAEKEAKLRAEQEERRKQEEERKAKFAAERALIEQQATAEREAAFAARVAEVAKKEEAAKEQMRLAKLEQARISEEKAKLKAQQKEAERLAKFVNKKK